MTLAIKNMAVDVIEELLREDSASTVSVQEYVRVMTGRGLTVERALALLDDALASRLVDLTPSYGLRTLTR